MGTLSYWYSTYFIFSQITAQYLLLLIHWFINEWMNSLIHYEWINLWPAYSTFVFPTVSIPVSHDRRTVCLWFLLVHQAFWAWCRSRFQQLIRGHPPQSYSVEIPTSEQQLSAHWWCFCAAHLLLLLSPLGTPRHCLSVDRLNSKKHTICRSSLIATLSGRLPQNLFLKKDPGSRLCRASWHFLTGIVISIFCALSTRSSLLQILRNSSRHHSVLMLLSLSSVTNLGLLFGLLCSVHAVIQMPADGVVGSHKCRCHSFTACTVDVTVCFSRQTVTWQCSHLGPLELFYTADTLRRNSCHCHPQSSLSLPLDLFYHSNTSSA